jgi:drug/metabolite transporter (DMT)-like permease
MLADRKYWFPAKRYGWGWSFPNSWEGWVVLAVFAGLLAPGSFIFPPSTHIWAYLGYVAVLCGLLIGVCWLKGEPPRWRWGGEDE